MADPHDSPERPAGDSDARKARFLESHIRDGLDAVMELLDLLGDTPIPGVDTKARLRVLHQLRRWCRRL
jgi:hypothetical protein